VEALLQRLALLLTQIRITQLLLVLVALVVFVMDPTLE
jgi:hypothetical protein